MKFVIIFLVLMLIGCNQPSNQKEPAEKVFIVKSQILQDSLHFTGTIKPIHESALSSSMNAVVEEMHYHYGQFIKQGEVFLVLNSVELQKQYNDTLTEYLKAKDNFTIAKAKFIGTQDLWNAGLLSKNNYLSEKSNLATMRINLLQASQKFKSMAEKMEDPSAKKVSLLSLTEFDKISEVLATKRNLIHIKATTAGVLLEAPKAGEDNKARITIGSTVKAGQVLGILGDLSGISVEIDIPEVDIHKIHVGMPATVEGVAFGGQTLKGKLVAINAEASTTRGGGLPSFSALVEVKSLTHEQQRWIKVGMSASITLTSNNRKALLIPISALHQDKGESIVKLKHPDNSISSHSVKTGAAQADKVQIMSGLKIGDQVLYG